MEVTEASWLVDVIQIEEALEAIQRRLAGDPIQVQLDMDPTPSVSDRVGRISYENKYSSADPTGTHKQSLAIAQEDLKSIVQDLRKVLEIDLSALRDKLRRAGSPYVPNLMPEFKGN
jgi:hypothetical protein